MSRTPLRLRCPEISAHIIETHRQEKDPWKKNRLLAIKLASQGTYSALQIAELCGISRSSLFNWIKLVRGQGLDALLSRKKVGRVEGWRKNISPEVMEAFYSKLKSHEFHTLQDARRWLKSEYGIEAHYNKVWYWAKKLGGVLRVPRPSHSKKDPEAAEKFKANLNKKLAELQLPQGTQAKVWVMDEARFGLHTLLRKVWGLKGKRLILPAQIKYEWDYLYGSLEVTKGETHFAQIGGVNLEWDEEYLKDLAKNDPETTHIIIRDKAGFHLRDKDPRVPRNIRLIDLPPYSPELNACEQLWDIIKDRLGNKIYHNIEELRSAMDPILEEWWQDPERVLSLIGRPWLTLKANNSQKT